ncbi:MAG: DoxX family membrane protein [Candidatus Margulisiibacteriota bacterium]
MLNKLALVSRVLLGAIYVFFGLNGLLHFLPMPPLPEATAKFFEGMMVTRYFFPLLASTQVLGGLMILTGIAAPLGLIILAPVTLNIVLFHVFMTPGLNNLVMPGVMVLFQAIAAYAHLDVYKPLFACIPFRNKG